MKSATTPASSLTLIDRLQITRFTNNPLFSVGAVGRFERHPALHTFPLLKGDTPNPFGTGAVDIMITNTSDVGGPENAAYTVWDPSAVRKMQEEAGKKAPVQLHTAIFPRMIGGPDVVAMVTASVALENARQKVEAVLKA